MLLDSRLGNTKNLADLRVRPLIAIHKDHSRPLPRRQAVQSCRKARLNIRNAINALTSEQDPAPVP